MTVCCAVVSSTHTLMADMRRWLHPSGLAPSMRGQNCNGVLNRPATARWPAESSPRQAHAVLRAKRTLRADAGIRRALVRPIEFAGRSPRRPACVVGEQLRTDKIELWPLAPVEEDQHEYGSGGGKAGEDCSLARQDGRKAAGLHELKNGNGWQRNGGKGIGKQRLRIPDASPDGWA